MLQIERVEVPLVHVYKKGDTDVLVGTFNNEHECKIIISCSAMFELL